MSLRHPEAVRSSPRVGRRRALVAVLTLACVTFLGFTSVPKASAVSPFPAQFVAKTYTEALGRIPDQGGWNYAKSLFPSCSVATLKRWGTTVWRSSEFLALNYSPEARTLALYRGILNREPDPGGLAYYKTRPLAEAVESLYSSGEFASLASTICSSKTYYFGKDSHPPIPLGPNYAKTDQATIEARLAEAKARPDGTAHLAQGELVELTRTLVIPSGVTLTTAGPPTRSQYAHMGRLVRKNHDASTWGDGQADPTIRLEPGARLVAIWVDGLRNVPSRKYPPASRTDLLDQGRSAANVLAVSGGVGISEIVSGRFDNAPAPQTIRLEGAAGHGRPPCSGVNVRANLVTAYSSSQKPVEGRDDPWTDGVFTTCERATIEANEVIDATDVSIIVGNDSATAIQQSKVRNNRILAAGNSAFAALAADPFSGTDDAPHSFAGTEVASNVLWTGDDTLFDIGLAVGTRLWKGLGGVDGRWGTGTGASFTGNWEDSSTARFHIPIALSGMREATVLGNIGSKASAAVPVDNPVDKCPGSAAAKHAMREYADGDLQPMVSIPAYQGCIG